MGFSQNESGSQHYIESSCAKLQWLQLVVRMTPQKQLRTPIEGLNEKEESVRGEVYIGLL